MTKRETWAVVTGALRDRAEAELTLKYLVQARRERLLQGIVFSTWHETREEHAELIEEFSKLGVAVVSSQEPVKTMMGNSWKQHKALAVGLELVPNGAYVLKCRTDKALQSIARILKSKNRIPEPVDAADELAVFSHKQTVTKISSSMLFNVFDISFAAEKGDLLRQINFSGWYDVMAVHNTINAEIRWFSQPIIERFPWLSEFYRNFNCRRVSQKILTAVRSGKQDEIPDYFLAIYGVYAEILRANFNLASHAPAERSMPLEAVWGSVPNSFVSRSELADGFHTVMMNDAILQRWAEHEFPESALSTRSLQAKEHLRARVFEASYLRYFDLEEIRTFDTSVEGRPALAPFSNATMPPAGAAKSYPRFDEDEELKSDEFWDMTNFFARGSARHADRWKKLDGGSSD